MDKKGSGIFEAVTVSNPSRVEPQTSEEILRWMEEEKMSAYNLNQFDDLSRKSVRVIKYKGVTKRETEKEQIDVKGYAIGYEGLINYINALLPSSEIIKNALRSETTIYPEIALRELIANALIHQDFTVRGAGPI